MSETLNNQETQENPQAGASELNTLLAGAGYEVVEGYENVKNMIKQKAGKNNQPLCSGYGVFPDGTKCKGCDDCKAC